jgi:hypothetical protein
VGKIEKKTRGRPWNGSRTIKMVLPNMGWQSVYLIHMTQDREKWRAPKNMLMGPSVA